jgi:hypothetical protein
MANTHRRDKRIMDFTKVPSEEKEQAVLADRIKRSVNVMLICKVVKVDLTKQRVDVQPCITDKIEDPTSKTFIYSRMGKLVPVSELAGPVIPDVPIHFSHAGNFMITIPVAVGDEGMLIISHQDLSKWKEQGGTGVPQQHLSLLDINNGIFIPGVPSAVSAIADYATDALEIRAGSDKIRMKGDGTVYINTIEFLTHKHPVGTLTVPVTAATGLESTIAGSTGNPT